MEQIACQKICENVVFDILFLFQFSPLTTLILFYKQRFAIFLYKFQANLEKPQDGSFNEQFKFYDKNGSKRGFLNIIKM